MNAFAELLRHLVMPDCSRRGRKWRLSPESVRGKTESAGKTKEENEMLHRASMSTRPPSVNSRKLSESTGTNERAQPATKALDFAQRGFYKGRTATRDEVEQMLTSRVLMED
jgi:hypothetical protein